SQMSAPTNHQSSTPLATGPRDPLSRSSAAQTRARTKRLCLNSLKENSIMIIPDDFEHPWDLHSLRWDLKPEPNIVELGGYEGRWSSGALMTWPDARIHIFEPQEWAFNKLVGKFENAPRVRIHNYGWWNINARLELGGFGSDGASVL